MEALGVAANVIAVVDLSAKVGGLCGEYIREAWHANDDIRKFKAEAESLQKVLEDIKDLLASNSANDYLRQQRAASHRLYDKLLECHAELGTLAARLDPGKNPSRLKRLGKALKWPFSSKEVAQVMEALVRWKTLFSTAMQTDQLNIALRLDEKIDLSSLVAAKGAAFDDYDNEPEPMCHPETRRDLLQQVERWVDNPDGKSIFWLCGPAGTGKSTISRTVANVLADKNRLAASFFFNRTRDGQAIQAEPDLPEKGLQVQFDKLILDPLSKVKTEGLLLPTLVLVIDALDECDSGNSEGYQNPQSDRTRQIVRLLAKTAVIKGVRVRIFLTSRPELPIQLGFRHDVSEHSHRDVELLRDIPPAVVEHDIRVFLAAQLEMIRNAYGIPKDWPGEDIVDRLVTITVPLFIYASTICKFVNDPRRRFDPRSQLQKVLSGNRGQVTNIRGTYQPILDQLLVGLSEYDSEQMLADFRRIVGSIILLADPLPVEPLSQLLRVSQDQIRCQLNNLHSVLDIPEETEPNRAVKLFHLSFREYLLGERGDSSPFSVDESSRHGDLLHDCLQTMSSGSNNTGGLRNDICQLDDPGVIRKDVDPEVIRKHIPQHLLYACTHWAHHLIGSRKLIQDGDEVYVFLTRHFVHWLEAMSWVGKMKESIEIVLRLQEAIAMPDSRAAAFLRDSRRFVLKHRDVINKAPCQVYSSAILFSPKSSIVKQTFLSEVPAWVVKYPEVADDWDPAIHVMKSPVDFPRPPEKIGMPIIKGCVEFSPHGKILATTDRGRIILWDTNTGSTLRVLDVPDRSFTCVSFISKGRIVAGIESGSILLWDFERDTETTLELSPGYDVHCVTSSRGHVACASADGTVYVREESEGTIGKWSTKKTFKGKFKALRLFSPDEMRLGLLTVDGLGLNFYDIDANRCITRLTATGGVTFDFFSIIGDEIYIVIRRNKTYYYATTLIDDGTTRSDDLVLHPLESCGTIFHAQFYSKGMLAYTDEGIAYVWESLRKAPRLVAKTRHSGPPKSISLSPDGKHVAIQPWNITKILEVGLLGHHDAGTDNCLVSGLSGATDFIGSDSVASSRSGPSFAIASSLGKITIWNRSPDAERGAAFMSSELDIASSYVQRRWHSSAVLAMSLDGVHLVVNHGKELYIWQRNPGSDTLSMVRAYSYDSVQHGGSSSSLFMCFSPCGRFLATAPMVFGFENHRTGKTNTRSDTVIWDFATLLDISAVPSFSRVSGEPASQIMSFGPSGAHLAIIEVSTSTSATLSLVHSASGDLIWELSLVVASKMSKVSSLAFNSAGTRIVIAHSFIAGPDGTTLSLVDAINGLLLWEVSMI
ncbi:Vegetative incompatibility protein HET-E-1 [Colletotrichum shisoi]|uniref:Vegetative incompatibility protein HET-E-1 n=1 Tax=Colletotrichum shisoi TaxID=2078593 RepID=A0A5Q4BWV7_9PEZI|nr:Vegetative incompatibility protein HET-E-1 [Colletotrichum shisoi]